MTEEALYLPVGSHLLPRTFQEFLIEWNQDVTNNYGGWSRVEQENYKHDFPTRWKAYVAILRSYVFIYKADVDAVKAYQLENEDELEWTQKFSHAEVARLPPLPESPVSLTANPSAIPEFDLASAARMAEVGERVSAMNQEIAELMGLQGADPVDPSEPLHSAKPRSIYYNHPHWPSPVPKLFVQKLKKLYGQREFERHWAEAGLPKTTRLIHEDCIFFLYWTTKRITVQDFLNLTPLLVSHEIFPYDVFSNGLGRSRYW